MSHKIVGLRSLCALGIGMAIAGFAAVPEAEAAMGRTAGHFDVSPTGAATYQIPIWLPQGPNGLQPTLSIAYNSSSGDGTMGPGWFLSGLGAISRCNKTYAQDGNPTPVSLAVSDGYCLNGNRLRLTSGSYGVAESTYQTELANFSNVTAYGSAGNGPGYFYVQTKDGLTYEYGNSNDGGSTYPARITASGTSTPYQWLLNKVRDKAGNSYVVQYGVGQGGSAGVGVPLSISYTPVAAGSSTYRYTITFTYTNEVEASTESAYVAGGNTTNANRLTAISVAHSGNVVRRYGLAYGVSPTTGRYRLTSVTECADAAQTNCLLPTTVSYQNGATGLATSPVTVSGTGNPTCTFGISAFDVNNDGLDDLVCASTGVTFNWYVSFGTATGFNPFINVGTFSATDVFFDDFMGDGAKDYLQASGGVFYRYRWNGSSFTGVSTGAPVAQSGYGTPASYTSTDYNGDGLSDLVWTTEEDSAYVRFNTTSGGVVSFASTPTLLHYGYNDPNSGFYMGTRNWGSAEKYDFNGDGRGDFIFSWWSYDEWSYTTTYSSSTRLAGPDGLVGGVVFYNEWIGGGGHLNDDACTDLSGYLSKCDGTNQVTAAPGLGGPSGTIDWNSDGRTDYLVDSGGTWWVYLSNGNGSWQAPVSTGIPAGGVVIDKDQDGQDDLVALDGSGGVVYRLHNGAFARPDLVTSIADGYGVTFSPTYAPISQCACYVPGSAATIPERAVREPVYVVSQFVASDGIGGTYTKSYTYTGARQDIQGRGFLGFQSVRAADSRTNAPVVKSDFRTAFPYTGMLVQKDIYQSNGTTLISRTVNTPGLATLDSTANSQRYFPNVASTSTDTYEVGGVKNSALLTQRSTSLTYDSYGNVTGATETLTDKDSTSPASPTYNQSWITTISNSFTPDAGANWCVSIPTLTTINRSTTGSSITRTTAFTPDYAMCRVTQAVVEPSSGSYQVTTAYVYDTFGNVSSETVTGIGMTGRQTQMAWGTTGQFPVSVTNALSQTSTAGYDYGLGVQTTATDANGLSASVLYDSFGRRTRETRIDGTYTDFSYADCASSGCQNGDPSGGTGINRMLVVATAKDSTGVTLRDDATYLDQFDRVIVTRSRLLGGGYSRVGTQFDALGNVYRQTAPCNAASCTVYWTTNAYDPLNRLTSQTRPISASLSTPQSTAYSYQGLTTVTTDAMGKLSTKVVDPNGWLRRSRDHDNYHQDFNYDALGSLKTVTDSLSNTLFSANYAYGIDAFQTAKTDMDLGTWTFTPNALGEVVAYTDANSNAFSQTFDSLSRLTTRFVIGEGTTTITYGNNASIHNVGHVASVSKTGGTIEEYTYDNKSRLEQRKITSDAVYYYNYTYGAHGQLDTLTYPTSTSSYRLRLKHLYANGLLQQVKDDNAATVFWQANATDFRGQVSQETLGNNVITYRAFDAVTGRISAIQSGVSGSTLQNESYLTDLVGNVTQRQQNNLGLTEDFFYDNVYRLTQSKLNTVTNLTVAYNAMGNITSRSDVAGGGNWEYHATKKHAVTQAGSTSYAYSYDANGNAQTRNGAAITWSKYNYPTVINGPGKTLTFEYDGNNQRFRQTYNNGSLTETTVYVGGLLEKVTIGTLVDWRHYVRAGTQTIAVISRQSTGTNTTRYMLEDNQGSVANILDGAGSSYVAESFTAFGARRDPATWSGPCPCPDLAKIAGVSRMGYTGHEAIGGVSMSLNHMNGRVQDAVTGVFLSADPFVAEPGNTQSFNRYSYVMNNPMSYTDPSGFCPGGNRRNDYSPCYDPTGSYYSAYSIGRYDQSAVYIDGGGNVSDLGSLSIFEFRQIDGWSMQSPLNHVPSGAYNQIAGGGAPAGPQSGEIPGAMAAVPGATVQPQSHVCTKDGSGWSILDHTPVIDLPSAPDWLVNGAAGLGDALLLGLGNPLRNLLGINASVDATATSYWVGSYAAYGAGMYRAGYALAARGYSVFAASGAEASAIRASMRMAGAPARDLTKYKSDYALRAAAGRTNRGMNAYGGGVAAAGAYGATAGCR